ncbi:hypothetical protein GX48_03364 [Paracoccidioides brasiliensis]|nr:hypothetical protein GX48_03364 [Paracoccidioides brasiliensis]
MRIGPALCALPDQAMGTTTPLRLRIYLVKILDTRLEDTLKELDCASDLTVYGNSKCQTWGNKRTSRQLSSEQSAPDWVSEPENIKFVDLEHGVTEFTRVKACKRRRRHVYSGNVSGFHTAEKPTLECDSSAHAPRGASDLKTALSNEQEDMMDVS